MANMIGAGETNEVVKVAAVMTARAADYGGSIVVDSRASSHEPRLFGGQVSTIM
jgi:hypothetical protein